MEEKIDIGEYRKQREKTEKKIRKEGKEEERLVIAIETSRMMIWGVYVAGGIIATIVIINYIITLEEPLRLIGTMGLAYLVIKYLKWCGMPMKGKQRREGRWY